MKAYEKNDEKKCTYNMMGYVDILEYNDAISYT